MTAYLTAADARTLAGLLPGSAMTALAAKTDAELDALLLAASLDLDHAMPYQGVPYAPGSQERAFPRYVHRVGATDLRTPSELRTDGGQLPGGVWDWDDSTKAAVVPETVKLACVYQAASLLDASFRGRLEAIQSGLASQAVGSVSESYRDPATVPGGLSGLCDRAERLMSRYRARSAPLL